MPRMRQTVFIFIMLLAAARPTSAAGPSGEPDAVCAGEPRFAARLYGVLRASSGNLLFSPTSIRMALAMGYAGARGATATELRDTLLLPDEKVARDGMATLLKRWDALPHDKVALKVVNRLWGQQGRSFRDDFLGVLRDSYGAPFGILDFRRDVESTREINRWVDEHTEHKIPELFRPGTLNGAGLVVTNCVYLKAAWSSSFWPKETVSAPFLGAGRDRQVPLMHQVAHFDYAEGEGVQVLELPYRSGELVMDVILPRRADGLARLEQQIADGALPGWLHGLEEKWLDVRLPRFHASSSFELARALKAMGMAAPFARGMADFSGIDGTHELYVGTVVHQAIIDVDERGTEAAAATGGGYLIMAKAPDPAGPIVFRADHPFVYLIRDTKTSAILFMGRFVDPAAR
jgi:serpin B